MNFPTLENPLDQDEMDAWLCEIDLIKNKIDKLKSGELTVEEFDRQQKLMEQKKQKQEEERQQKQAQELEKKRQGRDGKGEKKDYSHFCQRCMREYELPTETCWKCKGPTMTQKERNSQLMEKVQEYKAEKQKRAENRQKWDLMTKTSKMLWKKSSTNYSRWEYYETSSEEENHEPIVPKNDPAFQALEKDMQDRKKKKDDDLKKAEEFKQKGNEYMKAELYDHAVMKYSQALELVKDVKAIWLNRALAYLKLKKFRKAANDCTKVIEYSEIFEEGFTKSRESCFKAFIRRATALKERKEYEQALQDIDQAIILYPKDKEAIQIKQDIQQLIQYSSQVQDLSKNEKNSEFKNEIDQFIQKPLNEISVQDISVLFQKMNSNLQDFKLYFHLKNGIKRLLELINIQKLKGQNSENEMIALATPCLILRLFLEGNTLYQENLIKQSGISIVTERIITLLQQTTTSYIYLLIEDYLEMIINLNDDSKIRELLQKDEQLSKTLINQLFGPIIKLSKSETTLVETFIRLCSNLCYGPSLFKRYMENNYKDVISSVSPLLDFSLEKNRYTDLLISTCNLLSNFLTENSFRSVLVNDKDLKNLIFSKVIRQLQVVNLNDNAHCRFGESALAVLVNLTFLSKQETQQLVYDLRVGHIILSNFLLNGNLYISSQAHKVIIHRVLQILSKLDYTLNKELVNPLINKNIIYHLGPFLRSEKLEQPVDYIGSALRLIMQVLNTLDQKSKSELKNQILNSYEDHFKLLEILRAYLMSDNEIIFCNSCYAIGQIIDLSPLLPEIQSSQKKLNPSSYFQQHIPRLITMVRDRTGNFRKNAAILLAKLSKEPQNLQTLRDLHGIDILQSVIGPIMQK